MDRSVARRSAPRRCFVSLVGSVDLRVERLAERAKLDKGSLLAALVALGLAHLEVAYGAEAAS
jgi:hypothetical protein